MIDIKSLTDDDKGKSVVYSSNDGREFGVLSSWNERFVFVKFGRWQSSAQAQACRPEDVEFVYPVDVERH